MSRSDIVEEQKCAGENEASGGLEESAPDAPTRHGGRENIKVLVRIRPLLPNEAGPVAVVVGEGNTIRVKGATAQRQLQCRYDAVIGSEVSQEGVFSHVRGCTSAVLEGENSSIFAYGQTGSGKTYTMFGPDLDANGGTAPGYGKGIIPLAVTDLFQGLAGLRQGMGGAGESSVWCSGVQIYNEQLFDMLRDPQRIHPLAIHEQAEAGIYVQGLSEYAVRSAGECLQLLRVGREHRAIRETHMNQASSRSHSIFQIVVEQKRRNEQDGERILRSKFNLVDLAGSEKWDVKQDMAEARVSEMTNINVSLYTLGRVIAALSTPNSHGEGGARKGHVPYRDSKLTRLLQDSLGGNTRTRIIATLSPASQSVDETVSTLRFADRAKQVMAFVRVNEHRPVDHALVHRLQAEVKHLRGLVQDTAEARSLREEAPDGPTRPPALTALAEAQRLGYQETIDQLRRENTALRENQGPKAVGKSDNKPGQMESDVATLQAANRALSAAIEHIVLDVRRFFRFDIEEKDLRADLAKLLTQLSGSIPGGARWCNSLNVSTSNSCSALAAAQQTIRQGIEAQEHSNSHEKSIPGEAQSETRGGLPAASQLWKGGVAAGGQLHQEKSQSEHVALPPVTPKKDHTSEKLAYRLRGKHADEMVVVMKKEITEKDEELQLRKELRLAKERMKKNIQLQAWLLQKEQREIEMLKSESEKRDELDRDRRRKDEEFLRRAAKQKAKLKRFYETVQLEATKEAEQRDQELMQGTPQQSPANSREADTAAV
ncbi:unnamed protein product [Ectocarpus sp. 6 AP-2014]